jgi:hypothetical protein
MIDAWSRAFGLAAKLCKNSPDEHNVASVVVPCRSLRANGGDLTHIICDGFAATTNTTKHFESTYVFFEYRPVILTQRLCCRDKFYIISNLWYNSTVVEMLFVVEVQAITGLCEGHTEGRRG